MRFGSREAKMLHLEADAGACVRGRAKERAEELHPNGAITAYAR